MNQKEWEFLCLNRNSWSGSCDLDHLNQINNMNINNLNPTGEYLDPLFDNNNAKNMNTQEQKNRITEDFIGMLGESFPEQKLRTKIKKIHPDAKIPAQANPGDAYDVFSIENCVIAPGQRRGVRTGICLGIPDGFRVQIRGKSGLALKNGIDVFAGLIDQTYIGELVVILYNSNPIDLNSILTGKGDISHALFPDRNGVEIKSGQKIAQIVFEKIYDTEWEEVQTLEDTARSENGFGSSGK